MKMLRYYSGIILKELKQTTKTFRRDGRNSNPVYKECEWGILIFDGFIAIMYIVQENSYACAYVCVYVYMDMHIYAYLHMEATPRYGPSCFRKWLLDYIAYYMKHYPHHCHHQKCNLRICRSKYCWKLDMSETLVVRTLSAIIRLQFEAARNDT
jgi:hypothetical protein